MSCGKNLKNCNYKSSQTAFTNTVQAVPATPTVVNILGSIATDAGCSISTTTGGFAINNSGLYRISADITHTPTAAGTATFYFTNNGVQLPCALSTQTVVAATTYQTHIETTIYLSTCCNSTPNIAIVASGVDSGINKVCANATKLA